MSGQRYDNRNVFNNRTELYKQILSEKKKFSGLTQYSTAKMKYPTAEEMEGLSMYEHVWQRNDRLYKIAAKVYDSPQLWWVIAWFNQKPLEADYQEGEVIYIPHPLADVLSLFYGE